MPIKQAMILAAGYGKRLQPLTLSTPKPLVQVCGKPLLAHTLTELHAAGIEKTVINTHHLASQIHDYLREEPTIISHEETLLDTGGGVYKALPHFGEEPFLLLNADSYWQGTLPNTIQQLQTIWNANHMDALLGLVHRPDDMVGDYFQESDGRLRHRAEHLAAPYVYPGLAIIRAQLFTNVADEIFSIIPYFHKAQAAGRLYGLLHLGDWWDIGTPERLQALQQVS